MVPVLVAEYLQFKVMASLVVCLMLYLVWVGIREKLAERQERRWLENKRRELREKEAQRREGLEPPK